MIQRSDSGLPGGLPPGMHILCVDDETSIGAVLMEILGTHLKAHVTLAGDGLQALALIEHEHYDIIVLDFVMPKMNGGELYQHLKRTRPELVSRLLFITGAILDGKTIPYLESTGLPFLTKPFGLPELTRAIRGMVAHP